jgi:hypothetical protein
MEGIMRHHGAATVVGVFSLLMGACSISGGAHDVDYTRDRAISQDIDAARDPGPTALRPGSDGLRDEPLNVVPWEASDPHPGGP